MELNDERGDLSTSSSQDLLDRFVPAQYYNTSHYSNAMVKIGFEAVQIYIRMLGKHMESIHIVKEEKTARNQSSSNSNSSASIACNHAMLSFQSRKGTKPQHRKLSASPSLCLSAFVNAVIVKVAADSFARRTCLLQVEWTGQVFVFWCCRDLSISAGALAVVVDFSLVDAVVFARWRRCTF